MTPDKSRGHMMYQELFTTLDQKTEFLDASKPKGGYQLAKRLVLQSVDQLKRYPLIQFRYLKDHKLIERFRLEFVPVDLGSNGMEELHIVMGA
ncbi:hypothetical protein HED52_03575 [Ochrobactrum ciceri]|uniref:Uncharacterized protein n=1 Tax=Brucella ciceri TaxID=391287 RepID=A0ABX1DU59_9HYPH|nr:hypothetical protein [Brucella ciceri]